MSCIEKFACLPLSRKSWQILLTVLLFVHTPAWSDVEVAVLNKVDKPEMIAVSTKAESPKEESKMFNDEAKEMPGIVFGSIIVNSILVIVFFFLLRREWGKHKKRPEKKPSAECEEQ